MQSPQVARAALLAYVLNDPHARWARAVKPVDRVVPAPDKGDAAHRKSERERPLREPRPRSPRPVNETEGNPVFPPDLATSLAGGTKKGNPLCAPLSCRIQPSVEVSYADRPM